MPSERKIAEANAQTNERQRENERKKMLVHIKIEIIKCSVLTSQCQTRNAMCYENWLLSLSARRRASRSLLFVALHYLLSCMQAAPQAYETYYILYYIMLYRHTRALHTQCVCVLSTQQTKLFPYGNYKAEHQVNLWTNERTNKQDTETGSISFTLALLATHEPALSIWR